MAARQPLPVDPARLRGIVFDVDGTLYRQTPVRVTMLWKLMLAHMVHPMRGLSTVRLLGAYRRAHEALRNESRGTGDLTTRQLRLACEWTGATPDTAAQTVARWMQQEPLPVLARWVYDGVVDFVSYARERGIKLGILSDYPAEEKVRALGLGGCFDVVLSAQDPEIDALKPDPRGLRTALERLGVANDEALYVGDRPDMDGKAAANAGVACVIVGRSHAADGERWIPMRDYRELQDAITH